MDVFGRGRDAWKRRRNNEKKEIESERLRADMVRVLNGGEPVFFSVETVEVAIAKFNEIYRGEGDVARS